MAVKELVPVLERPINERIKSFEEVVLGYAEELAVEEAKRCLQCKVPTCVESCPVGIDIPKFIKQITQHNFEGAFKTIKSFNYLPATCGRVCPQETQCEGSCVLNKIGKPINIGALERFVADWAYKEGLNAQSEGNVRIQKAHDKKIAVVGSGPAGLTVSSELGRLGFQVEIFETLHELGGVLVYGIPEFRLPKEVVKKEISDLKSLNVVLHKNTPVGYAVDPRELLDSYDAVFIGVGAGTPKFMGIEGTDLNGVYSANEFLTRINLMRAYKFPEYDTPVYVGKRVAVIGGGNTAMDVARSALRLGAEVYLVYRRTEVEMPARRAEIEHAKEEGVKFMLLTIPIRYIGDSSGRVVAMECVKMVLGEPDESGRRKPVPLPGSNFILEVDTVVEAIGTEANRFLLSQFPGLKTSKHGYVVVNEWGQTSIPKVFAGGDIVTGSATVISAMGAGKRAAQGIMRYLVESA